MLRVPYLEHVKIRSCIVVSQSNRIKNTQYKIPSTRKQYYTFLRDNTISHVTRLFELLALIVCCAFL